MSSWRGVAEQSAGWHAEPSWLDCLVCAIFSNLGLTVVYVPYSLGCRRGGDRGVEADSGVDRGTTVKVLRTFTLRPRPETGLDCLACVKFARSRRYLTECIHQIVSESQIPTKSSSYCSLLLIKYVPHSLRSGGVGDRGAEANSVAEPSNRKEGRASC